MEMSTLPPPITSRRVGYAAVLAEGIATVKMPRLALDMLQSALNGSPSEGAAPAKQVCGGMAAPDGVTLTVPEVLVPSVKCSFSTALSLCRYSAFGTATMLTLVP